MTLGKAARTYNIPKSTLFDHKIGNVQPGVRSGHPTVLTIVYFIIECAEIRYPRSRLEVIAMAERFVPKKSEGRKLTSRWWQSLGSRHPILSLKMATSLSVACARASCPDSLKKYYTLLEETMNKYRLQDDPALIYNMHKSGFPLDPKPLICEGRKEPVCSHRWH